MVFGCQIHSKYYAGVTLYHAMTMTFAGIAARSLTWPKEPGFSGVIKPSKLSAMPTQSVYWCRNEKNVKVLAVFVLGLIVWSQRFMTVFICD